MCMLCAVIACNRESEEYHNDTVSSLTEEQALSAFAQTSQKQFLNQRKSEFA